MSSLNLQTQKLSEEYVKPSSTTPTHLKTFKLSLLDQIYPSFPVPTLLFYHKAQHHDDVARNLKSSLSSALSSFYPFAGRFESSTIDCNDEGVPFIENKVHCSLASLLSSVSATEFESVASKLYPPKDLVVGTGVEFAIQVNVFTCGGVVIGWYHMHKGMDGVSASTFLMHWATLARQREEGGGDDESNLLALAPDLRAASDAFPPPSPEGLQPKLPFYLPKFKDSPVIVKSFVFKSAAISELKATAASKRVQTPSRFLAVGAFLWQQLLLAESSEDAQVEEDSLLTLNVDLRQRTNPPLPKQSIGNFLQVAIVRAAKQAGLGELVADIHESVAKVKDIVAEYKGEKRVEAVNASWKNFAATMSAYKGYTYVLTSWCRSAGFMDVDFGFGKPNWIVPTDGSLHPMQSNTILLTEFVDSDGDVGFEAWLFLYKETMAIVERNQQILKYASPRLI